jgi:hypothetical protein
MMEQVSIKILKFKSYKKAGKSGGAKSRSLTAKYKEKNSILILIWSLQEI